MNLPPLEEVLRVAKAQWEAANAIAPTATTWEQHEHFVRSRYEHLSSLTEEERDAALFSEVGEQTQMLISLQRHLNTLIASQKAKGVSRGGRRKTK